MNNKELYLSKSSIETFNQCELKFEKRYVTREKVKSNPADKEAAVFGNIAHSVLERYHKGDKKDTIIDLFKEEFIRAEIKSQEYFELGHRLLPDYVRDSDAGHKILAIEHGFRLYLDNGVPIQGYIDRIDEISKDELEIIDYKTGRSLPLNEDQIKKDLQMGIYNLAALQEFPGYKRYKLTLNYLHFGSFSTHISPQDLEAKKDYLAVIYRKITKLIENKGPFIATENSFCSYCDYKGSCDKFQEIIHSKSLIKVEEDYKGLIVPDSNLIVPIEKLDKFLDIVIAKKKILISIEKKAKAFIKKVVEEEGVDGRKNIGNKTYVVRSNKITKYDVNEVIAIFKESGVDLNQVLDARKIDIDAFLNDNQEDVQKLLTSARISYTNSYVR